MRISFLAVVPLVFAGIIGLFAWGMYSESPDDSALANKGQVAPELILQPMAGKQTFSHEDLVGDGFKLVNFWASWCTPCRVEHPMLEALSNQGIPIFGVNYKDDPDNAARFLSELGDPYAAVAADPSGRNAIDWGVIAMPETFLIDGDGRILARHKGAVTQRIVEELILPALAQSGSEG